MQTDTFLLFHDGSIPWYGFPSAAARDLLSSWCMCHSSNGCRYVVNICKYVYNICVYIFISAMIYMSKHVAASVVQDMRASDLAMELSSSLLQREWCARKAGRNLAPGWGFGRVNDEICWEITITVDIEGGLRFPKG